jgi:putative aldouronate transport system substrate-binding protein
MKKHISRREVLRLLAGMTAGVALASCGAAPTATPEPAKPAAPAAPAATATTAPKPTAVPAKKVSLTVVVPSNVESFPQGQDENNNDIIKFLREKTGYDIKWIILPTDSQQDKLNLLMSSNEPPDIIAYSAKTTFGQYLDQGLLAPIDDYLKDAPELQKLVPADAWAAVKSGGKTYAVPVPQNQNIAGTSGILARKDWLKELGLKEPVTTDEYYTVLKAFKDTKKVIPFTQAGGDTGYDGLIGGFAGAFGVGTAWKVKDNKIVCSYIEPEAKDFLTYMNKLYTEGLLDKEYPVNKAGTVQEKMVSGQAGMASVGWANMVVWDKAFKDKNPSGDLNYIQPPKGPTGLSGFPMNAPVRMYLMVSAKSKNPKEAVNFLNMMMQPDIYYFVSYGVEGTHYQRKDGQIFLLDAYQQRRWQIYYILVDTQEAFAIRLRDKGFIPWTTQTVKMMTLDLIDQYAPPITDIMTFNMAPITGEYFVKFITGDMPLTKFDEFVAAWKSKGGDKALAALNKWYSESYKK